VYAKLPISIKKIAKDELNKVTFPKVPPCTLGKLFRRLAKYCTKLFLQLRSLGRNGFCRCRHRSLRPAGTFLLVTVFAIRKNRASPAGTAKTSCKNGR